MKVTPGGTGSKGSTAPQNVVKNATGPREEGLCFKGIMFRVSGPAESTRPYGPAHTGRPISLLSSACTRDIARQNHHLDACRVPHPLTHRAQQQATYTAPPT